MVPFTFLVKVRGQRGAKGHPDGGFSDLLFVITSPSFSGSAVELEVAILVSRLDCNLVYPPRKIRYRTGRTHFRPVDLDRRIARLNSSCPHFQTRS